MAPGKTAPRLLQDLLTFDPRREERAGRNLLTTAPPHHDPKAKGPKASAVPRENCRHTLWNKDEQSLFPVAGEAPNETTIYKIASYCSECRWHIDVGVDFCNDGSADEACKKGTEHPLHHFVFDPDGDPNGVDGVGSQQAARTYMFICAAPKCPVRVHIHMKPPHISDQDVETLTNQAQLRLRFERAKQLAGDRADTSMARKVDGLDFLNTYLQDALNPAKSKARIPLLNKKFLKTFGRDCDSILMRFGFTTEYEEEDGDMLQIWHLPKPEEESNPLEFTLKNKIEDARYELNTLIMNMPEGDRANARHKPLYPGPSQDHIERALGCNDYDKVKGRTTRSTTSEEDHPYYAGLGALGDFADDLLAFAVSQQIFVDPLNMSYYFECIADLARGRQSEELNMVVATLSSRGCIAKSEVDGAYRYFNIDPAHAMHINDEHVVGTYKSYLADVSPSLAEEARRQLRIIGDARDSAVIRAEANNDSLETYEQALSWLDMTADQSDDFIETMVTLKKQDNPGCDEKARKAVSLIAEHRNSDRLRQYLRDGTMTTPEMDIGEAYAIFSISDRTAKVDFDVMKTAIAFAPPESAEKMQKAYQMIEQDQAKNFNNQSSQSEVRRNEYPLETWPVGLRNIGNTCYLNSVLQFLFTIRPLRELILNCEDKLQDPSPAAISGKVVGREAVTAERVEVAQKFVHELRTFFQHMITAPTDTVQPDIDLAALALCKTTAPQAGPKSPEASTDRNKNLGSTEGPVIGPMPMKDDDHADTVDSVMGDDKSDTSMKAMDLRDEPKEGEAQSSAPPEPPNRPPPIPPRPTATKSKLGNIEESARQQDAAEVLSNIFNLISCALQGESVVRENEQWDIIKRLFFSDVTSVRMTKPKPEEASELRDHFLVSPGWRDRNIYATLDDDFGLSELEGEVPRFEFVAHPAAIQIINLRRLQFDRVKGEQVYDRSHIALEKTLYMDRYLGKTQSLPQQELLKLRHVQWDKQRQLRTLEERRDSLRKTDIEGLDLPDVLDETSAWLSALEKEYAQEGDDSLPTPPPELADSLSEKASQLKKDLEGITTDVTRLEAEVENVFQSARDYPYRLHAVFTHRGGTKGGHYWIYIFDFQTNSWRKYNDDLVTPAKEEEVLNMHAELASMQPASTGVVYIRESMVDELTEAVKREPLLGDVEMKDADEEIPALVDGAAGVKSEMLKKSKFVNFSRPRVSNHGVSPDNEWKRKGVRLESPPKKAKGEECGELAVVEEEDEDEDIFVLDL